MSGQRSIAKQTFSFVVAVNNEYSDVMSLIKSRGLPMSPQLHLEFVSRMKLHTLCPKQKFSTFLRGLTTDGQNSFSSPSYYNVPVSRVETTHLNGVKIWDIIDLHERMC